MGAERAGPTGGSWGVRVGTLGLDAGRALKR